MLAQAGSGFGALAAASLLHEDALAGIAETVRTHHAPRAKRVVWLFMNGGPSGIDLFDPKPALDVWHGKPYPGKVETLFPHPGPLMKSPFRFRQHGESGAPVSEVFPHLARHVDELAFLLACSTEVQNHMPACYMMNCAVPRAGMPCLGSWVSYGLGRETADLPAFVVLYDQRSSPEGGTNLWDMGFLPGQHQGVALRSKGSPILYLQRPGRLTSQRQHAQLQLLNDINGRHLARFPHEQQLETRLHSFETAFRMQRSVPEAVNIASESKETQRLYGLQVPECKRFGRQLLMTRRLLERGVRFAQVYHGGFETNWDHHGNLEEQHRDLCFETDQPIAGFLEDLKRRGLLDETLVIWGGEFGRTPVSQDRHGRDHNPFGFTMWMAGGGVKRGIRYGQTDEFGYHPVENRLSMHDLHATILHLLGLDHLQLSYFHNGQDQLPGNGLGHVVHDLIA